MSAETAAAPHDELSVVLDVLRAIPGVDKVEAFPAGRFIPDKLNQNKVRCRVWTSDEDCEMIQVHCGADCETKLDAALKAKRRVAEILGDEIVATAEERVRGAAPTAPTEEPPTEEELEWLANWIDEKERPELIDVAAAEAALRSRRSAAAGAATTQLLMEHTVLQAKVCATHVDSSLSAFSNPLAVSRPVFC